jgi:hypothetical protein
MLTKLTVLTQKRVFSFRELGPSYVIDRPSHARYVDPCRRSASARQQEAQLLSLRACNSSPHECFELGVGSSARAARLPMATVLRKNRAIRKFKRKAPASKLLSVTKGAQGIG